MGGRGEGGSDHNDMIHMCEISPLPKKEEDRRRRGRRGGKKTSCGLEWDPGGLALN